MMGERHVLPVRAVVVFGGLGLLLIVLVMANLCMGSLAIAPHEIADVVFGGDRTGTAVQVVWGIRLPRLVAAGLLGGALALCGVLLQAFFNNPLAGPYILGISSGAKLAVATVMIAVVGAAGVMASWMSVLAAFLGSLAVMLLMLLVSRRIRSATTLVVAGVMLGYVCTALTDFLVTFASDASIVSLKNWSMGSFSGTNWNDVGVIAVVVFGANLCVFAQTKALGAYLLGEDYAQSVGVSIGAFRISIIVLSSMLAACVTAFAGPISFVGIAVPHIVKRLLNTSKPLLVVPGTLLGGADFCLLCDLIARTAFAPTEMSVSTVTALFGAPVVLSVLMGKHRTVPHRSGAEGTPPLVPVGKRGQFLFQSLSSSRPSAQYDGEYEGSDRPLSLATHPLASLCRDALPGLVTSDLSAGYGKHCVVSHVDINVRAGEVVTLIGPNGAGKSTLLRTMAGLQEALDGSVILCGEDLVDLSVGERSRLRAVLLTGHPHTELLTCEDVVAAGRHPYTGRFGVLRDDDWACVCEAMELMHVWELRDKDYMQLSDGQRQRVLLARALCQQPRVLVLDEPTSYLDVRYQIELFAVLCELAHTWGMGIVMSLHDLALAKRVSDRLVCIKDGAVLAQGTVADIFTQSVMVELFDLEPGMCQDLMDQ